MKKIHWFPLLLMIAGMFLIVGQLFVIRAYLSRPLDVMVLNKPIEEALAPNPDEPPQSAGIPIEEYERNSQKEFEAKKAQWLKENPPVEYPFDVQRRYDKDYVMYYLKNNSIGGDCALVWIDQVICWDGDRLRFPTKK